MLQLIRRFSVSYLHQPLQSAISYWSNPLIPLFDSPKNTASIGHLKDCKHSELIFGIHPVLFALRAGKRTPYKIFIKDLFWNVNRENVRSRNQPLASILDIVDEQRVKKEIVKLRTLNDLCNNRPHQGVVLECSSLPTPLLTDDHIVSIKHSSNFNLCIFLDEVKDVMNFASILRSAAFFSTQTVFLPTSSSCFPQPLVSKISSGAMETLKFYRVDDKVKAIERLRENGFTLIGTAGQPVNAVGSGDIQVDDIASLSFHTRLKQASSPFVVVLGSEDVGVSKEVLSHCNYIVRIPGDTGTAAGLDISSLNVSVATAIILHSLYNTLYSK